VPESTSGARIRPATRDDVPAIVRMLADDPLGSATADSILAKLERLTSRISGTGH